ncbi:hypothetical protein FB451DRAFT_695926 [Mycena latifolia]|nr:hypothetical protein FB451DRAFT_695926 [Mycena latifolia]
MDQDTSYTRVDDLWFPEGTLVIRAERTIFRVIQSILAARSSVFRDMLALPQPTDSDTEIIDGSPGLSARFGGGRRGASQGNILQLFRVGPRACET